MLTKLLAKILVFPAIFSFVLACCHPPVIETVGLNDDHTQFQAARQPIGTLSDTLIKDGSHCDHAEQGQMVVRVPAQKVTMDLSSPRLPSFVSISDQYPIEGNHFVVPPRITGPPWEGKSIKGFLGVYRS